jgi:flagellin
MSGAFQVSTNIRAQQAFNQLRRMQERLSDRRERLATGSRINGASDDATGLQIAAKLESKIGGQKQSVRNINDAKSMLRTAEEGLSSQLDLLQTMREKAVQAANGVLSDAEEEAIQKQLNQLTREVQDIAENTEFNGTSLLKGADENSFGRAFSFQTGAGADDQFQVSLGNFAALGSESRDETAEGKTLNIGIDSSPVVEIKDGRAVDKSLSETPDQHGAKNVSVDPGDFGAVNDNSYRRGLRDRGGLTTFFSDGDRDALTDSIVDADGDPTDRTSATGNNILVPTEPPRTDAGALKNLDGGTYDLIVERTGEDEFEVRVGGSGRAPDTIKTGVRDPNPDQPSASVSSSPADPEVGEEVTFDASGSSDPEGDIERYEWDFDGDGNAEATGTTVTTSFSTAGEKEVALTVEDDSGLKDFATETVQVRKSGPSDPVSDVSAPPDPGYTEEPYEPREVVGGNGSRGINPDHTGILLEEDPESGDALTLDLRYTEKSVLTTATGGVGGTGRFSVTVGEDKGIRFKNDVTREGGAQGAMDRLDDAIDRVTSTLSDLGAKQNRLSFKQENLETTRTNLRASRSRIEDTDFARTQAQAAKLQILQESGIARLTQANAVPESVLSLVRGGT